MEIETTYLSFKRLIIFPFQYLAEKKLNKKIRAEIIKQETSHLNDSSRLIDLLYRLDDIISRLNKILVVFIFVPTFHSHFLVSVSLLINIGKEMTLPRFRSIKLR